ncbi:MAG: hypothetical protein QOF49_288 [Chloroflexota bacterium]|nr:hypothetical protein [Chloroflexota bacterium]
MAFRDAAALAGMFAVGVIAGIAALVRGLGASRSADRVAGTATSRIASLAAGEALVSGAAEAIELTLVSPLQSVPSIYYRSRIATSDGDGGRRDLFDDERAVGFRVRDASGWVRVFPSGAMFDVPDRFDETAAAWGGEPTGLRLRTGAAFGPGPADRESLVRDLLTVHAANQSELRDQSGLPVATVAGGRHYREARIEIGDIVTVTGQALPFRDVADPAAANVLDGSGIGVVDPEVARDVAEARTAGRLRATPADAWGNAAIPGFGIGQPIRPPDLDAAADRPQPADADLAGRVAATFDIPLDSLVFAASAEAPLLVALGPPSDVTARGRWQLVLGLLGAVVAIGSAMGLAFVLNGIVR